MRRKSVLALLACLGLSTLPALAADSIEGLARTCDNCHGDNGVSAGGSMPSLGGQSEAYLKNIMMEWKSGDRAAATMNRLIKGYSDDQVAALAKYYAALPWTPLTQTASAGVLAKGKDATDKCSTCHGDTGGQPDDENTPRLNGQAAMYLHLELDKYRDEGFKMTHKKMIKSARKLEEGDVGIAAQYYGSQSK
jgi:sulfide dehydrogenase cytochrome subunit